MTFAADTTVPVDRSRSELERILQRYGATAFAYGWDESGRVVIRFKAHHRLIRFELALPSPVLLLRRPRPPASEPSGEHPVHDHRWVVNGHWRWQAHGTARSQRRLTWISPYVKGPEGAPLKPHTTVRAWVR